MYTVLVVALVSLFWAGCGPPMNAKKEATTDTQVAVVSADSSSKGEDRSPKGTVPLQPNWSERVLVLENLDSPVSMQIAKYYMEKRGLTKKFSIRCPDASLDAAKETLPYKQFQEAIEKPLKEYLQQDSKIDFIVLNKGIPIRLTDAPIGLSLKQPSLDSYLAALDYFDRTDVLTVEIDDSGYRGRCFVNRYWNAKEPFQHAKFGGYLVARLDGYSLESAKGLVDSALMAETSKPTGTILLDAMATKNLGDLAKVPLEPAPNGKTDMKMINEMAFDDWNTDIAAAAKKLESKGLPLEYDATENFLGNRSGLMGYVSWGSNDAKFVPANYASLRFAPGAIAETAVSTSGRTFLKTTGGQSLVADLIEARVSAVKGYCDEPFLVAIASPTILLDRYTQGWTMAESFYAASRFVGWEDIVIGDPIMAPYAGPNAYR